MTEFSTLTKQRELIHRVVSEVPAEALMTIPACRRNNIAWNLGHIVTVQQALTYGLSGVPMNLPQHYRAWYFRDTSPADWDGAPDIPAMLEMLKSHPAQTEADYKAGTFATFQPYTTVTGIKLDTIEDALGFNNFHEGIHFGMILSIRKELGLS